jgi:hypothetical protein
LISFSEEAGLTQQLEKVLYKKLNAKQQESYNFQKVSGVLADYGFVTIRLSDDWEGADFLAHHIRGHTMRVQLKGRLWVDKKYQGKDLWICFRDEEQWYFYPHDEFLKPVLEETNISNTSSWKIGGRYSFPKLSKRMRSLLQQYKLG